MSDQIMYQDTLSEGILEVIIIYNEFVDDCEMRHYLTVSHADTYSFVLGPGRLWAMVLNYILNTTCCVLRRVQTLFLRHPLNILIQ